MSTSRVIAAASLFVLGLLGACGGKQLGGGGGSSGSGGVSPGLDGGSCVDIILSSYDQSCNQASDCISIASGEVCEGSCDCGGSYVNAKEEARYQSAISSITLGECFCPAGPVPECIHGTCSAGGGTVTFDAGAGRDSEACVDVDLSTYDRSCNEASDCIGITSGKICPDSCECGGSTINKSGEARYEMQISGVSMTGACPCPPIGEPQCIHGTCTLCGFSDGTTSDCPDGG